MVIEPPATNTSIYVYVHIFIYIYIYPNQPGWMSYRLCFKRIKTIKKLFSSFSTCEYFCIIIVIFVHKLKATVYSSCFVIDPV